MPSNRIKRRATVRSNDEDEWFELLVKHGDHHSTDDHEEIRLGILKKVDLDVRQKLRHLQPEQTIAIVYRIEVINRDGSFRSRPSARASDEATEWRKAIFEMDKYCCRECGSAHKINAHHIQSWAEHPDLRFDLTNGITLCQGCHILRHPDLAEFIKASHRRPRRTNLNGTSHEANAGDNQEVR